MFEIFSKKNKWPNDADGGVLRNLEKKNFDFSKEYLIDFNIDFDQWPLPDECVKEVKAQYLGCEFIDTTENEADKGIATGYVLFQVKEKLTYDLVIRIQKEASTHFAKWGGRCESWGLFSN